MKTSATKSLIAATMLAIGLAAAPAFASPVAVISAPNAVLAGQMVTLNALLSYDTTAGATLNYAWDLDFDGRYTDSVASMPKYTVSKNSSIGDVFQVGLLVTDNFGGRSTTVHAFEVVKELPQAAVPEPVTAALFGVGAIALAASRRKRRVK